MTDPDDTRLPSLTVQHTFLFEELLALLIGTLDIDSSTNCLVVRTPSAERPFDVAWPLGSTIAIRDGIPALIDATGQTVAHVGDEVSVGGGWISTTTAGVTSCTGQDHVWVGHHPRRI
ncbi:hypothetical protein [Kribbella sp. NPDC049584]|uniref:hypothetical protein n=1 Tax=Kribbella sp. NPDC049584 TaxID=3154833 RepID=UPI003435F714